MKEKFNQLQAEYDNYDKLVMSNFRMLVRDTEKGIWGPANIGACFRLFKKIGLKGGFIDLGSGDGRIVLVASLFGSATGIEFSPGLVKVGEEIRDKLGLKASFITGDFLKYDLSKYDVIFINPDTGFENGLEDKLLKEMKPGACLYVYNEIFLPRFLKKGKTYHVGLAPIIVYRNVTK